MSHAARCACMTGSHEDVEHSPSKWVLCVNQPDLVVLSAMCVCGDDNCHFTMTSYASDMTVVHIKPE
jgi:hypothetical protein